MSDNTKDGVTIGGAYKESDEHVPASTDLYGTFNTSGTGASQDPATTSPIFDVDRKIIAAEILKALDPEDDSTPASRVLFSEAQVVKTSDDEAETKALKAAAEEAIGNPVVVGGPSKAEAAAAETAEPVKDEDAKPVKATKAATK